MKSIVSFLNWKRDVPAVDTDAVFCHLVLARLQIAEDFLRDLGEVATLDQAGRELVNERAGGDYRTQSRTCRS